MGPSESFQPGPGRFWFDSWFDFGGSRAATRRLEERGAAVDGVEDVGDETDWIVGVEFVPGGEIHRCHQLGELVDYVKLVHHSPFRGRSELLCRRTLEHVD